MRWILTFAALSAGLSVVLGAFSAHGLRGKLPDTLFNAFETGVQYQMIHSLALFGVGLVMLQLGQKTSFNVAALSFLAGILLFSGSLYGLALLQIKWLGPITPVGGLCLIVGWLALAYGLWFELG
ncbi:MAG: DUF423 domain-containing protein [Gammaproteobacteria bacterium]|jgi:uncharacterized membrane protein YgdD (TMEM256/DUF423 family)|nr:DUF423 domain-containing protein [Gammaproteobacteria bacterium]MBT5204245.1 DUF423 domain-containing protein [Gammaproteobacteria bacterium]MBT5602542.1 DUF423 domain-containing protein [Gammaproteobacteria bacterium]MBT6246050.1 DUF423 domain-containing protein [Gammaproteobacteria bacterium]